MTRHQSRSPLALAIVTAAATPAANAALDETLNQAESEFTATEASSAIINHPDMAQDAEGNFIVVWAAHQDEDLDKPVDIRAQRYDAEGDPLGSSPLTVASGNAPSTGDILNQIQPAVAMDDDGNAVVTWVKKTDGSYGCTGKPMARSLDLDQDSIQGDAFSVINGATVDSVYCNPDIAMDSDGDYVIAMQEEPESYPSGIVARRFQADHQPLGSTATLDSSGDSSLDPAVALSDNGQWIATWANNSTDRVEARLLDFSSGDPVTNQVTGNGFPFQAERLVSGPDQENPAVAVNANGDFILAWSAGPAVAAQLYKAGASIVQQGSYTSSEDTGVASVDAAIYDRGEEQRFVVGWGTSGDSINDIPGTARAQGLTPIGDTVAAAPLELYVNETATNSSRVNHVRLAANASGDLAATWNETYHKSFVKARSAVGPGLDSNPGDDDSGGDDSGGDDSGSGDSGGSDSGDDDSGDDDSGGGGTGPLALLGGALALAWRRLRH